MTVLGLFGFGAIFFAAIALSRATLTRLGEWRWSVAVTAAMLLQLAVPTLICRFFGSTVWSTILWGVLAAAGAILLWRFRPAPASPPRPRQWPHRWALVVAGLAAVLVVWTALRQYLWDEYSTHFALTHVLSRGLVPPEHPLYPGHAFRYHYGFDALAAQIHAFSGIGAAAAIDVVTIGCYGLLLACSASVGASLSGRRGASLALILAPLGGAFLQSFLLPEMGSLQMRWALLPAAWLNPQPPPVISNFFQHPVAIGMPAAIALLLFLRDRPAGSSALARGVAGGLLLGALSLGQLAFFLILTFGLFVETLIRTLAHRRARLLVPDLVMIVIAFGTARALGGFFEPGPTTAGLIAGKGLFEEPLVKWLFHHFVLFGIPLLAVPLAIVRLNRSPRRVRGVLIVIALAGFLIPALLTYRGSWDIVKFYGIGAFAANLLLADLLAALLASALPLRRVLVALLLVLSLNTSALWLLRFSALDGRWGVPKIHFTGPTTLSRWVGEAVGDLIGPRERVLSSDWSLHLGNGFLTPGFHRPFAHQGLVVDHALGRKLDKHVERAKVNLDARELAGAEIRWLALNPAEIAALPPEARAALSNPNRFRLEADVGLNKARLLFFRVRR